MRKLLYIIFLSIVTISVCCTWMSCGSSDKGKSQTTDSATVTDSGQTIVHKYPDTLRVATLYSPLSYFLYRDDTLGYDYSLIKKFTKAKDMHLQLTIAKNLESAVNMLDSGKIDVIAYEVPVTSEYVNGVYPCGPENYTTQVLVQNTDSGAELITDVTQLVGKKVWVQPNSKYLQRLDNLNEELGGGIDIQLIRRDSIIDEDIIEMVSKRRYPLAIIDSYTANLNKTYFDNVDVSVDVSFRQRSSWGVAPAQAWLGDSITAWFESEGTKRENSELMRRYFEESKAKPFENDEDIDIGRISPYDSLFRVYAKSINWDWRLMLAMAYVESRFDTAAVSWAGARGLMQIMPATARGHGVDPDSLFNPVISISTAAKCISSTEKRLSRYASDPDELRRFVIAAYNAGSGHITDAIMLAQKYELIPDVWYENVETALIMKSDERYYNDPVVKNGYCRARETVQYVRKVEGIYNQLKEMSRKKAEQQKRGKPKKGKGKTKK